MLALPAFTTAGKLDRFGRWLRHKAENPKSFNPRYPPKLRSNYIWEMRKLPLTAAEELLEIIMRHERVSTMLTSNRPVEDWGKLLGDAAAVSAMLDRLLHHGHVLKCAPRILGARKPTCLHRRQQGRRT